MNKHTPGPWNLKVHTGKDEEIGPVDDWTVEGGGVAICFEGLYNPNAQADARLIAAAPELLEQLINARKELEDICADNGFDLYNNLSLNAAIAKATGESA